MIFPACFLALVMDRATMDGRYISIRQHAFETAEVEAPFSHESSILNVLIHFIGVCLFIF